MRKTKRVEDKKILILGLLLFVVLSCITIGYAFTDEIVNLRGVVTVYRNGSLVIENVEQVETDIPTGSGNGLVVDDEGNVSIDYKLIIPDRGENTYEDTYLITIFNDSHKEYTFTGFNIDPEINITGATQEEVDATITYEYVDIQGSNLSLTNNKIPAGERRYLGVKLTINATTTKDNTTIDITGEAEVNSLEDHVGQFYGILDEDTKNIDLTNNNIDCFNFSVLNTHNESKTFSIRPGNTNFKFVTRQGADLGNFTISAPDENNPDSNIEEYEACIMKKSSAIFPTTTETSTVILSSPGMASFSMGSLDISVPKTEAKDEEKVHISDVTFERITYDATSQSLVVKATWNRLPDQSEKSTSVSNYYIQLYDSNNSTTTPVHTFTVPGDATIDNYTFQLNSSNYLNETNMVNNNHSYFIKVYGVDAAGNSGLSDCSSGTTNEYCVQSSAISLKYKFNISLTSSNNRVSFSNANNTTAYLNNEYTNGLQVSANNYTLDTSVTVTMGNTTLRSGTDYTFGRNSGSNNRGTITINPNVINNDIRITASASYSGTCVTEETKVTLANGKKVPVGKLKGNEEVLSWNFETGKYEAKPIVFIDGEPLKEYKIIHTIFDDGTDIGNSYEHGYFDVDLGKFIYINEKDPEQYIGHSFIKQDKNNKWKIVKLVDIKHTVEKTRVYDLNSFGNVNFYVDGMLSISGNITGIFNYFDVDTDTMKYNPKKMKRDLEKYGEFTYEDFGDALPKLGYDAFNGRYLKVAIGKGVVTWNGIEKLIEQYGPLIEESDLNSNEFYNSKTYSKYLELK